ncbi:MAG: helix-hairpin-helix domain-containing protein [bacterium]|nr:helix-hairpin-helix domain-containing protein [bacterium]
MTDLKLPDNEAQPFDIASLLEKNKIPLLIGLSGLVVLGAGLLFMMWGTGSQDKIEILSAESSNSSAGTLRADIEGAVEKPGVYTLSASSRVDDLLIVAGGLNASADREWVERTLNRAQKLTDGMKIYVPEKSTPSSPPADGSSGQALSASQGTNELVNINTASQAELEALSGIGPVTAKNIIQNRPYQAVDDLLTKKILKSNLYQKLKSQLAIY